MKNKTVFNTHRYKRAVDKPKSLTFKEAWYFIIPVVVFIFFCVLFWIITVECFG